MLLKDSIELFLQTIDNPNTRRAYRIGLHHLASIAPQNVEEMDETIIIQFHESLANVGSASMELYISAAVSFFAYLVYTKTGNINLDRARLIKRKLCKKPPVRISDYPMDRLTTFADYVRVKLLQTSRDPKRHISKRLQDARDRALILTLAETGLRRHEAAALKVCDVDFDLSQAVVIGKGNKQAVIYFGYESMLAILDYLDIRANKDNDAPLFMRHDRKRDKTKNPVTGNAIAMIVKKRAAECLASTDGISPHALRHYFITTVWSQTGDVVMAKELGRHDNIQTTMRYTHVSNAKLKSVHSQIFGGK